MYSVEAESIVNDYKMSETSLEEFASGIELKIVSRTKGALEFDLINVHSSIANALRRILIAEVPTIAIHSLSVRENDTIFPDEYLAHRLGLIPVGVDPEALDYVCGEHNHENVLKFKLSVKNDTPGTILLYSDQITWIPMRGQEHISVDIKPGVLICKMAAGNTIDIEMTAEKGIGQIHAKWSPVSLCSYKLMPRIVLEKTFSGEDARELKSCFSEGVIEIVDGRAAVANPRIDTMSREVFRHEKFADSVKILRESNWFCFTIETISLDPLILLRTAISILDRKCQSLKKDVLELKNQ